MGGEQFLSAPDRYTNHMLMLARVFCVADKFGYLPTQTDIAVKPTLPNNQKVSSPSIQCEKFERCDETVH